MRRSQPCGEPGGRLLRSSGRGQCEGPAVGTDRGQGGTEGGREGQEEEREKGGVQSPQTPPPPGALGSFERVWILLKGLGVARRKCPWEFVG